MCTGTMDNSFKIIEGFSTNPLGTCVGWDDYRISNGRLFTVGIGPCLAIAIYDSKQRRGALAHISGLKERVPRQVYPENIVGTLVSRFRDYEDLEAFLTGENDNDHKMSQLVRTDLASLNIPIIGEDLGKFKNYRGREIHIDCQEGKVQIYRYPY